MIKEKQNINYDIHWGNKIKPFLWQHFLTVTAQTFFFPLGNYLKDWYNFPI